MRKVISLHDNWTLFKEGKEENITLPHSFNAEDGQGEKEMMFRGKVSYRKTFVLEEPCEAAYLEIGAASQCFDVFLNGNKVGESHIGFALKRYEVTSFLKNGENHIEIQVSNAPNKNIYPSMADFSFYGGIYRPVNLILQGTTHFDELDGSRDGILLFPSISGQNGKLKVIANVATLEEKDLALSLKIQGQEKRGEYSHVEKKGRLETEVNIPFVHRWNGVNDPFLYEVEISLIDRQGRVLDRRTLKTGFRTMVYDEDHGFMLNGKPYPIKGVARHQDYGGKGNAIGMMEMKTDLALIQEMGANAVRLSHYQHADEFYSLCDEAGLLVYAEIPVISAVIPTPEADQNAFEHLEALISQVRNHVSVFCYGVQNEVCMVSKNAYSFDLVKRLAAKAKQLDPSRMTAQANEYTTEDDCEILHSTDILGFNLYYGWYYGKMEDLGFRLDAIRSVNPSKMILLTEYGVDTNPRFHSDTPRLGDYSEEYQVLFCLNALKTLKQRTGISGSFVWTMFDFGSASRYEGGRRGINQKGLVSIDRKIKKDAFYLYKASWTQEKFVHICGKRYENRATPETTIQVISNCPSVSLFVNGKLVERQYNEGKFFVFEGVKLRWGKNEITAKSEGYVDSFLLNRVERKDPSYSLPKKKDTGGKAANWFEHIDVKSVTGLEKPLRKKGFTLEDAIVDIGANAAAKEVFLRYLSPLTESSRFSWESPIPVSKLLGFAKVDLPDPIRKAFQAELNQIDKE